MARIVSRRIKRPFFQITRVHWRANAVLYCVAAKLRSRIRLLFLSSPPVRCIRSTEVVMIVEEAFLDFCSTFPTGYTR